MTGRIGDMRVLNDKVASPLKELNPYSGREADFWGRIRVLAFSEWPTYPAGAVTRRYVAPPAMDPGKVAFR